MIISRDTEKVFDKIQHPFRVKVLGKSSIYWTNLNIRKVIYSKPTANTKLNGENLKSNSIKIKNKTRLSTLFISIQYRS